MRVIYTKYLSGEDIPVYDFAKKRKLVKYYTRETMAAIVAVSKLYEGLTVGQDMPFFYSTGEVEMLQFYRSIATQYATVQSEFSSLGFIEHILPTISPLEQFKMMRNMTACFVSIENGLKGDNAVLLSSASGLLYSALFAQTDGPVLIGTGKQYADGTVECGFAEIFRSEIENHPMLNSSGDAITLFKNSPFIDHVGSNNRI